MNKHLLKLNLAIKAVFQAVEVDLVKISIFLNTKAVQLKNMIILVNLQILVYLKVIQIN